MNKHTRGLFPEIGGDHSVQGLYGVPPLVTELALALLKENIQTVFGKMHHTVSS